MFSPLSYGLEKGLPVLIQRPENLLRDFGWQGFVGVVRLHAPMHLMIVEIDALFDEGLPYLIVGRIVQVLGSKSRLIYRLIGHRLCGSHAVQPVACCSASNSCTIFSVLRLARRRPYIRAQKLYSRAVRSANKSSFSFSDSLTISSRLPCTRKSVSMERTPKRESLSLCSTTIPVALTSSSR